jgi:hypothetical protein
MGIFHEICWTNNKYMIFGIIIKFEDFLVGIVTYCNQHGVQKKMVTQPTIRVV